ncbi:MAG: hypothetical protein P4K94_06430 [Terracidiphilus sp.]|nr:hypothetical protein [Terracidiphilus sp.]
MSATTSSTKAAFRLKATSALSFLLCSLALATTGCMSKTRLDNRAFTLAGPAEFPILAPSNLAPSVPPSAQPNDFQKYPLVLTGNQTPAIPRAANCAVKGDVFSLAPAKASNPKLWSVTSLTVDGWQHRGDTIDMQAEWLHFAHQVLALQQSGCFPQDESPDEILRQISQSIPLPASEELFFTYALGRTGFVDLVPGMQVVIERAAFQNQAGARVPAGVTDQFTERLAVVHKHNGSSFRLLGIDSRGLGRTLDQAADSPRSVPEHFGASPQLRLMLLTLTNDSNTRRFPVLLGSSQTSDIWETSDKIVAGTLTGCPPASTSGLQCQFLGRNSAVSVLMSVWVNGHRTYSPLGTTLGSLLGRLPDSERNQALATLSMERPLVGGGYAPVNFPRDLDSARNVILLNGDRLTWRH